MGKVHGEQAFQILRVKDVWRARALPRSWVKRNFETTFGMTVVYRGIKKIVQ